MRKILDQPISFSVTLGEVIKYGLFPLEQLKRNLEAKLLFPKKTKEVKNNVIKQNS